MRNRPLIDSRTRIRIGQSCGSVLIAIDASRVENAPNHASACQPLRRAATQAKKQQRNGTPTLSELLIAANNADWQQVVLNGGPPCFHFDKERQRFCLAAERWPGHGVYHPFTNLADMIGSVTP
jgi:hypothetical protein